MLPLIAPLIAMFAKNGLDLVGEAVLKKGKQWVEDKAGIKLDPDMTNEQIMDLKKWQGDNQADLEKIAQENLTARHQADMSSDSWLSKNVRPLCLLLITLAIVIGIYLPAEYVDSKNYQALTDMGVWVYGYYFVGRSAFDKGNVKLNMGKK